MAESVYIVVYNSPDIKNHFVEIKGVFASQNEAQKCRELVFEKERKETTIQTFIVMDTIR